MMSKPHRLLKPSCTRGHNQRLGTLFIYSCQFDQLIDGQLTPEQMAEMLNLPEGDIEGQSSNSGKPDAASGAGAADDNASKNENQEPAAGAAAAAAATGAAVEPENLDPANAVILAKDGKHTISYDKLVAAREGEKHWKAQAEAAQRALAELQAAAQARADAGVAPPRPSTG